MPSIIIPVLFVLIISVAWFISAYNRFIKYKNKIEEAWSGIDVALKRRFNLVPNLVRAVEGYAAHEAKVFKPNDESGPVADGVSTRIEAESRISKSLRGLLALAQAYPDLKASKNFLDLQDNLDEIEEDIQKSRNRYNNYVGRFNTLAESFPAIFIAKKYGFTKQRYFTLDLATQREMPEVDFSPSGNTSGGTSGDVSS